MKIIKLLCRRHTDVHDIQTGGTHSYHSALKDKTFTRMNKHISGLKGPRTFYLFLLELQPNLGLGRLVVKVSRSYTIRRTHTHTHTPHIHTHTYTQTHTLGRAPLGE